MTGSSVRRGGQGTEECCQYPSSERTRRLEQALLAEWEGRRQAGGRTVFAKWVQRVRKIKDSGVPPVGGAVTDREHITQ